MEVILLERIEKLGQMGDVVNVKPGFARNYLLPQRKALRATTLNRESFESRRTQLEAVNLERKSEAEAIGLKLNNQIFMIVRQASDNDQLYGSVTVRNIAQAVTDAGFTIDSKQVQMGNPIKSLGLHSIRILLHPEISATITVNVARSEEEAELQAGDGFQKHVKTDSTADEQISETTQSNSEALIQADNLASD